MFVRMPHTLAILGVVAVGLLGAGCNGDDTTGDSGGGGTDEDVASLTIDLDEQDGSGVSGEAVLTEAGEETTVSVTASDAEDAPARPMHVHSGTCDELGDVVHPLTDLQGGTSETTIDASLQELEDGEFAINAHESADAIETYVACGEIS